MSQSLRRALLPFLALLACASDAQPPTLLDEFPRYRKLPAPAASQHSSRGMDVATQGCDALHRGFVARSQPWVDCASESRELRIDVHGLPDPDAKHDASAELVAMVAMVESSWCLAHELALGDPEAKVTIVQPDGRITTKRCVHFMSR